jgi:hypothetical protein
MCSFLMHKRKINKKEALYLRITENEMNNYRGLQLHLMLAIACENVSLSIKSAHV